MCCSVLHCVAVRCSVLHWLSLQDTLTSMPHPERTHCNTLHFSILHRNATHCSTWQHRTHTWHTWASKLPHSGRIVSRNTLQHIATHDLFVTNLGHKPRHPSYSGKTVRRNTLQYVATLMCDKLGLPSYHKQAELSAATHCNTLQNMTQYYTIGLQSWHKRVELSAATHCNTL